MKDKDWDLIITSNPPWLDLKIGELWRYRYLIAMFVRRDFVAAYKQTILGPLWFVIPPVLSSVTFTIVFGQIANISTDGQPQFLFYMSGVVMWGYFNLTVTGNSSIFTGQSGLFSKVYFPRLIVPITNFLSGLFHLGIQLGLLAMFTVYFLLTNNTVQPQWALLLAPVLIVITGTLGLGVGIVASALTTRYRDLSFLITFGINLWMYATPVIYPLSSIPQQHQWIMLLNPMASIITTFRYAVLGSGSIPYWGLAYSAAVAVVILMFAALLFNRIEKYAMDTV
ncbi:MAG: ABC transporter permease [Alphaproteobacteria bacterium]